MNEALTPGLLVSMPNLQDPYFEKSVILLCDYTEETAFGLVINRPSTIKVKDVLVGDPPVEDQLESHLLIGGPVQPEFFWAVHSCDFETKSTTKVDVSVYLSSMQEVLLGLAQGHGPKSFHLGCGYAGWGPGQLDREIKEGAWWVAPMNAGLVLNDPYPQRWETVLRSLGIDPFTTTFPTTGEA